MSVPFWTGESLRSSSGREVSYNGDERNYPGVSTHVIDFGGLNQNTYVAISATSVSREDNRLSVEAIAIDPRYSNPVEKFPSSVNLRFNSITFPPQPGSEAKYLEALRVTGTFAPEGLVRALTI